MINGISSTILIIVHKDPHHTEEEHSLTISSSWDQPAVWRMLLV